VGGGGGVVAGWVGVLGFVFCPPPMCWSAPLSGGPAHPPPTTGTKRATLMPDVPTIAESGFQGYEALNWYGYLAPAKTPKEVVDRLHREIAKALANPKVIDQLAKTGVEPAAMTPQEFGRYLKTEYDTWGKVVKQAGIKAQ
jgi:tripartite-type tricarboxylate transporter receptor subunit TctC